MRWYTRAWQRGDEPAVEPGIAYADYVRSVEAQLPVHVREFALPDRRHLAVDDAKVDRAEFDRDTSTLRLRLLNGDVQTGYGKLVLEFANAAVTKPPLREANELLADRRRSFSSMKSSS